MPKYALELYDDENLSSVKNCPIKRYGVGDDDSISVPFKVYTQKEYKEGIFKYSEGIKAQYLKDLDQLQKELIAEITMKLNTHSVLKNYIPVIEMYVENVFNNFKGK